MTKTKGSSQQVVSRLRREKVSWRLQQLSQPRPTHGTKIIMPALTPSGIRISAVRAECPDRIQDMSLPFLWRLFELKKNYKHRFTKHKLEQLNFLIEAGNATMYAKLANAVVDLKKAETKKSRAWNENDWKKHMDHIRPLATPKPVHLPKRVKKKKWKPLPQLLPRIQTLAKLPEFKVYKRVSQEDWYRDPIKVQDSALKYVISERVKVLAKPRELPPAD